MNEDSRCSLSLILNEVNVLKDSKFMLRLGIEQVDVEFVMCSWTWEICSIMCFMAEVHSRASFT